MNARRNQSFVARRRDQASAPRPRRAAAPRARVTEPPRSLLARTDCSPAGIIFREGGAARDVFPRRKSSEGLMSAASSEARVVAVWSRSDARRGVSSRRASANRRSWSARNPIASNCPRNGASKARSGPPVGRKPALISADRADHDQSKRTVVRHRQRHRRPLACSYGSSEQ